MCSMSLFLYSALGRSHAGLIHIHAVYVIIVFNWLRFLVLIMYLMFLHHNIKECIMLSMENYWHKIGHMLHT